MNEGKSDHRSHADQTADGVAMGGHSHCSSHDVRTVNEVAQPLKDPVCGMTVSAESTHVLQHEGKPIYFCSSGCKAKFVANPAKYEVAPSDSTPPAARVSEPAVVGTIYTCPMHPQIRQVGPGNCPICGMTLSRSRHRQRSVRTTNSWI